MPALKHIHRFPIKGFSHETLTSTRLEVGSGIEDDRRFALATKPDIDGSEWMHSRSFIINSIIDGLQNFSFSKSGETWSLTSPDGKALSFDANDNESQAAFNSRLPAFVEPLIGSDATPYLIERVQDEKPHGMWDYIDANLSIINLNTVRALEKITGTKLDAKRFRGNLLIDDLPASEEFAMSGMRYAIGEAEIEVTRPIDRCPATSVNPKTGERDEKIPALLANHFGHGFCGIYAHVVKQGKISEGDQLREIGPASATHLSALLPNNAPEHALWPRFALVAEASGNTIKLVTASPWPLLKDALTKGKRMRLHLGQDKILNAEIETIEVGTVSLKADASLLGALSGLTKILVSGPFGKLS